MISLFMSLYLCCNLLNELLCYVVLCCVVLCYVMLCYVMLCYVMLCYVMLCYFMLCLLPCLAFVRMISIYPVGCLCNLHEKRGLKNVECNE